MDSENIEKIIFYSWQSDLPSAGNHYLIRDALRGAIKRISRDDTELKIRVDHDTLGASGSPDIKQIIFEKIDQCTVFICDISIINQNQRDSRKAPNPNVLIEMGYAAAKLGWARIILVFNEYYGKLEDLPFDIRANRISKYNFNPINASKESIKEAEKHLENIFSVAVRSVLESEHLEELAPNSDIEEIRRTRDIETLKKVLYTTYIPVVDKFFELARKGILHREIFNVMYALDEVVSSSDFYLYDQNLMQMALDFYNNLNISLSFGSRFDYAGGNFLLRSSYSDDDEQWTIDYANFLASIDAAESIFRSLIEYTYKYYIEIDIKAITQEITDLINAESES